MNHNDSKMKHPSGLLGNDDGEQVEELSLRELLPFQNHPFHVEENEELHALMESIQEHGVMVPIIVRPKGRGTFEIIAGHRRTKACQLLGRSTIPAFIRDMDEEDAVLFMVDTNIQRETLLFSEKAFAYKMKLDALKKKAGRPKTNSVPLGQNLSGTHSETNSVPVGQNLSTREQLAQNTTDSSVQIQRYIRLTQLSPDLLQRVDKKKVPFQVGVELSYLTDEEQQWLLEWILQEKKKPTLAQATQLKKFSQEGTLSHDQLKHTLATPSAKLRPFTYSPQIRNFFQEDTTKEEMEQVLIQLLTQWKEEVPHNKTITILPE